jgi:TetR/AcrR family transcriptional regulator, transcriptional repressor for nem operon
MARPRAFDTDAAVDAAMQQFWSEGYAATTPTDLEQATGLGRGSLYNAFDSKRDLFLKALHAYIDQGSEDFLAVLGAPGRARERLKNALALVLDDPGRRGCLVTNTAIELAGRDPEIGAVLAQLFDDQRAALAHTIAEGIADGDFDPELSPHAAAEFLVALANGIRVLQRGDRNSRDPRDIAVLALTALEKGVTPQ